MGSPLIIKKHGVIIHEGSPLVSRESEEEYWKSLRPSKDEGKQLSQQNKKLLHEREERRLQNIRDRKTAVKELNKATFQKRLAAGLYPTVPEIHERFPVGVAKALILLLKQRKQIG